MFIKKWIPWYFRLGAKLLLSRIPAGYQFWRRINLFAHGAMQSPEYAERVFEQHFTRSGIAALSPGLVAMEIGPGDSVVSAMFAQAHGATRYYLVDAGAFATSDLAVYRATAELLVAKNLPSPAMRDVKDMSTLLHACNAEYKTRGLASLREIPSGSIDFVWSQAVLEHIRRSEFLDTMKELRRVMSPRGVGSHRIDLKDHLGGALNNLRMASRWWEADWVARSGFYTNRLRYTEMLALFRQAGFSVEVIGVNRWERMPMARAALAPEFRTLSDDDLLIREFDVLLRPVTPPLKYDVPL